MAEEANDVQTQAVETQETTTPAPSTVENKAPEVASDDILSALSDEPPKEKESKTEPETEAEPEPEKPEPQEKEEGEETEEPEQPRAKKDANQRIRQLVADKRNLERQVAELNAQVYKPQTVQELVAEGESEALAEAKVLRQEMEVREFNRQVTELNSAIEAEAAQVMEDLPMFNPESDDYDEGFAQKVSDLYQRNIQRDPRTGLIVSATSTPYEFYKAFADARSEAMKRGEEQGKIAGQRATAQMLASAEPQSSAATRESKKDPILEALTSSD